MANFILYDLAESKFHNEYPADEKTVFGGPWGDESKHVHLPIPDGVDYRKCNLIEVVLIPPNTEDDIDFDYKCEYTSNFESFTKYYKFEEDAGKSTSVDEADALVAQKEAKNNKKNKGTVLKQLCLNLMDIITGHAIDNGLTGEQMEQVEDDNSVLYKHLKAGRGKPARNRIDALVADGTLITQDMLDDLQLEITEFEEANPTINI